MSDLAELLAYLRGFNPPSAIVSIDAMGVGKWWDIRRFSVKFSVVGRTAQTDHAVSENCICVL